MSSPALGESGPPAAARRRRLTPSGWCRIPSVILKVTVKA